MRARAAPYASYALFLMALFSVSHAWFSTWAASLAWGWLHLSGWISLASCREDRRGGLAGRSER